MGKIYGYVRVSVVKQDLDAQISMLKENGVEERNIFVDIRPVANEEQSQLHQLLQEVKEGDLIMVKQLDRLGRSVSQVVNTIERIDSKGVHIKSIDDEIDTSLDSVMSKAMLSVFKMFSEMERNFIVERTKPAIERAKEGGVKFGRPKANSEVYDKAVKEYIESNGEMTFPELVKSYGKDEKGKDVIKQATFFRRLREYKQKSTSE